MTFISSQFLTNKISGDDPSMNEAKNTKICFTLNDRSTVDITVRMFLTNNWRPSSFIS